MSTGITNVLIGCIKRLNPISNVLSESAPPKRVRIALALPKRRNHVWSVDFISDALTCGRRFRIFNLIDDFNRQRVHIEVDTAINSARPVWVFEQIKHDHGLPKVIRSDNAPEFLGEAFKQWREDNGVNLQHIQPGKPNQYAFIVRFKRTFREELLNRHQFAA